MALPEEDAATPRSPEGDDDAAAPPVDRSAVTLADTGTFDPTPPVPTEPWSLFRLPLTAESRYVIEREIAQGGIGRVLVARDTQLDRKVALKEPLRAGATGDERFVREALLTAGLEHPSIVPVYDAGRLPTGRPYYAMKLVAGRTLSELLSELGSLDARLRLLPSILSVAEAMAYAHAKRIIHRDLKPSNVLFGPFGEAVVIDWGLAKRLDDTREESGEMDSPSAPSLTVAGTIVGTPTFMSPEQANGAPVDERADVYALGAILYCVIAGKPPYEGDDAVSVVEQVRLRPPRALASLAPRVPLELTAIVEKAMSRELDRRYRTALELAEDLSRLLTGGLVSAHQYTLGDLALRFVRKHRVAVAVAGVALLVLLVTGALSLRAIVEARRKAEAGEQQAVLAERRATERSDLLVLSQARSAIERDPTEALTLLASLSSAQKLGGVERSLVADAREHGLFPALRGHRGIVNGVVYSPDGHTLGSWSDDHAARLWDARTGASRVLEGHRDEVWGLAFSPDGSKVATASKDGTLRVFRTQTAELVQTLSAGQRPLSKVTFLAGGAELASIGEERALRLWDLEKGSSSLLAEGRLKALFTAGRRHALSADAEGHLALHDLDEKTTTPAPDALRVSTDRKLVGPTLAMTLSDDGALVVAGGEDGTVRVWTVRTSALLELRGHRAHVERVALSPDGREIASSAHDGTLRIWDRESGTATQVLEGHDTLTTSLRYSPDGRTLASSGVDRSVHVWEQGTWTRRVLRGPRGGIAQLAFSPDGAELAAACNDGDLRLARLREMPSRTLARRASPTLALDIDARDELILAGGADGELWSFSASFSAAGGAAKRLGAHRAAITDVAFAHQGSALASASEDGTILLFRDPSSVPISLVHQGAVRSMAFSPDGRYLLSGDAAGALRLFTVASGEGRVLHQSTSAVRHVAFSPDGATLAAGTHDGAVLLVPLPDGPPRELGPHGAAITRLAFSLDGQSLLAGSDDHALRRFGLSGGAPLRIDTSGSEVTELLSVPGSGRIVVGSGGSALRVFSSKGTLERILQGHEARIGAAAVSPEGRRVVSASDDRTLRIWDLETGESRALSAHTGAVRAVRFSHDGKTILSAGDDGRVRLWKDELPWENEPLRAFLDGAMGAHAE